MVRNLFTGISKKTAGSAVTLLGLAFIVFHLFITDEKGKIRELFSDAAGLASFEGEEHPFASLDKAGRISRLFSDNVTFILKRPDRTEEIQIGRKALKEKLMAARTGLAQLAVAFTDFDIRIERDTAKVSVTGKAMGRDPGRADYFLEVHRIDCQLQKRGGRWTISKAENADPYTGGEYQ